ncbi:PIN domain-containing protein [Pseudomonas sivasensis]|uniref:PIN domain-containing protein n=1 Tax=Pseudomonas sivasensis TaxID=1880678 RepID=UPI0030DD83CE
MKGLFPQYDASRKIDYKSAWKEAIFVFDTNVLLNMYRYQQNTRDELLSVLQELSEKIWIPFHVALEFQRNRLTVIAAQGKKFSEVRKSVEKIKSTIAAEANSLNLAKRHTLIDFDFIISEFDILAKKFLIQLDDSQKTQQKLTAPDLLKDRIEELFENRVGPAPDDQSIVETHFKVAEQRYKHKTPPGYMDSKKDEHSPDEFVHSGVTYKRKYGDYLIWKQLLDFAEKEKKTKIIFVTDDAKEDWWLKYNSEGTKTIGPRPELIEEAKLIGGINTFIMYNPEGFLQYAKEFLKTEISETTLEDVRDTSKENQKRISKASQLLEKIMKAKTPFRNWVISWGATEIPSDNLDLLTEYKGLNHGYEIRPNLIDTSIFPTLIKNLISRATEKLKTEDISTYTLAFCLSSDDEAQELLTLMSQHKVRPVSESIIIVIGILNDDTFTPYVSGPYIHMTD